MRVHGHLLNLLRFRLGVELGLEPNLLALLRHRLRCSPLASVLAATATATTPASIVLWLQSGVISWQRPCRRAASPSRLMAEYKSANKMYAELTWGARRQIRAHPTCIELRVSDDHQQQVAFVEVRRQPDNTISLAVWGTGDEPLYEAIVKQGADVVRAQTKGGNPKGPVLDLPIAVGAPGRRKPRRSGYG